MLLDMLISVPSQKKPQLKNLSATMECREENLMTSNLSNSFSNCLINSEVGSDRKFASNFFNSTFIPSSRSIVISHLANQENRPIRLISAHKNVMQTKRYFECQMLTK